ncbi:MAG TPA: AI-2E family transporter [Chthoniobacteraceae bacterium]|nr:AI-2E family transporter [Verrucomicrobiae bacterium]HWB59805.1 AI-2E family transporter [Chthoniobacteraceae bacterium]
MSEPSEAESKPSPHATPRLAALLTGPFEIRSIALTGLFGLAIVYTMYFTRAILLPIVLAMLLSQLLAPLVRLLGKCRIPQMAGSGIILLFFCGVFVSGISLLAGPMRGWIDKAPQGLHDIEAKLAPLIKTPMKKMSEASGEMKQLASDTSGTDKKTVVVEDHSLIPAFLYTQTPDIVGSALTLLILLYFLLGYNGVFLNKLVKVIPRFRDKKLAVTIASDIEKKISSYLITVTFINFGLGCAIAIAMYFLGLPNPVLWGVAAAILNFVPYLGPFTGVLAMTVAAVLSFDSFAHALVFPGVYILFAIIEGNFITPMLLGRSLTLNPVAILISLMFWGWLWGIVGVILAVPLLATMKILCDHIEPLSPLGEFMSE